MKLMLSFIGHPKGRTVVPYGGGPQEVGGGCCGKDEIPSWDVSSCPPNGTLKSRLEEFIEKFLR